MIALLVGSTLVSGLVVSWYGYSTMYRIRKWGEKMNELDAIFQSVATEEEMAAYLGPGSRPEQQSVAMSPEPVAVGVPQ